MIRLIKYLAKIRILYMFINLHVEQTGVNEGLCCVIKIVKSMIFLNNLVKCLAKIRIVSDLINMDVAGVNGI